MMNEHRPWLSWIAIGIGAVALLVALSGGFALPFASADGARPAMTQSFDGPPQHGPQGQTRGGPQVQGTPPEGPQAQTRGGPQVQDAPQGQPRHGERLARPGGFLRPLFMIIGGLRQIAIVVVLALLGFWLLRGRHARSGRGGGSGTAPAAASEPYSGETQQL